MNSLTTELKQVIARRLESATSSDIIEIVSQLCEAEQPVEFRFDTATRPRFVKLDGAIEDTTTGLIWSSDDLGTDRLNWADAKKAAAKLDLCGFKDWRLPTIKELLTLVDYERSSPAIDPIFATCKSDWYWTSTPLASSPSDCAWYVYFGSGSADYDSRSYKGLVRAVRARQ